ncbi:MAG: hypothetical protein FWH31_01495 [Streptococcaceae bacterium]|nr:hypothetical protein [Streptococcaceae bacterium]
MTEYRRDKVVPLNSVVSCPFISRICLLLLQALLDSGATKLRRPFAERRAKHVAP